MHDADFNVMATVPTQRRTSQTSFAFDVSQFC